MGCRRFEGFYKGLQWVTRGYEEIQGVTEGF